jgi:hypothetical protein
LERVLQQLHDSKINAGVQTFYDAGMRVWIGEGGNGDQSDARCSPQVARRAFSGRLAARDRAAHVPGE